MVLASGMYVAARPVFPAEGATPWHRFRQKPPLRSIGDPLLLNAMSDAIHHCLAIGDVSVRCAAMSCIPTRDPGEIAGLIGVHGEVTGYVTVDMATPVAIELIGSLLIEKFEALDHQVIDGVGELTNMIAVGIEKGLTGTDSAFSDVTVPSVVVGQSYDIALAGLSLSVDDV